jgi:hypothetical protein
MFQNACTGNVAIYIDGGRDALVWQQCSEKLSIEYTIVRQVENLNFLILIWFRTIIIK